MCQGRIFQRHTKCNSSSMLRAIRHHGIRNHTCKPSASISTAAATTSLKPPDHISATKLHHRDTAAQVGSEYHVHAQPRITPPYETIDIGSQAYIHTSIHTWQHHLLY
eukprot:GHUV01042143.1.p1 GENE.GHUV01042143.1~~GHUV01042143.1.p1  ORF type:complete len:108 (-),score=18.97 GHUV01042143.1:697-1020(-)